MFNENTFLDACVEEIVNENTVKLAVRVDDAKVIKTLYLDGTEELNVDTIHGNLKSLFMIDTLGVILPVGSFVKVKITEEFVTIFNRKLDKNLNNIIKIIQNSNARYVL